MALDSGLMEGMSCLEPSEQSVLNTALVARPMEGTMDTDPSERSVLAMHFDYGLLDLESPARPALDATLDGRPMEGIPDPHPLENSGLVMALDSELKKGISGLKPLEHSVINMDVDNNIVEIQEEPMFGSDRGWSFLKFTDTMREEALKIRSAGQVPAGNVGRVAVSPAMDYTSDRDMCNYDVNSEGFRCWNTDQDVMNQYETFNGLPVYYGGDMYDSEDSELDDPLELARMAYVEDYNFDVPEGMDVMVHHRSRSSDDSGTRRDDTVYMVPVCQMVSCVTRIGPDTFSDTAGTENTVVNGQDMDDFYQWAGSSDDEDFIVSDVGSSVDISLNMPEEEELINTEVESVVDFDSDDSVRDFCGDSNKGSVAELEWNTWDKACALDFQDASGAFPPDPAVVLPAVEFSEILFAKKNVTMTFWTDMYYDMYYARLCLILTVCYDCLCLIALFRTVMSLPRDWVEVLVWTGHDKGYGRSSGWELRDMPQLYPPCVVYRVADYLTEIKVPGWSFVLSGDMNNSARRCVCIHGTPMGVFSTGRISLTLIGCRACVGGSVSCSNWPCLDHAVDFSPGESGSAI